MCSGEVGTSQSAWVEVEPEDFEKQVWKAGHSSFVIYNALIPQIPDGFFNSALRFFLSQNWDNRSNTRSETPAYQHKTQGIHYQYHFQLIVVNKKLDGYIQSICREFVLFLQ